MPNALLDDLAEEDYIDALLNGNMKGEKKKAKRLVENPVAFERFTSEGYFAGISRITCKCCGSVTSFVNNVFHREKGDMGSSRAVALHMPTMQIPLDQGFPVSYMDSSIAFCPGCIESHGFSLHNITR